MKKTKHSSNPLLSLLLIGSSKSGKTALIRSFDGVIIKHSLATIGVDFNIHRFIISDGNINENITIQIYDSPGNERFKSVVFDAIKKAQGIMIVYDVTDRNLFKKLVIW